MTMPKKFIPLIVAGVLGLAATFLINMYISQQTEEAKNRAIQGQKSLTTVVVAREDIPSGTTIVENMLREATVSRSVLQPKAATSLDRVVNRITIAPIAKDEQILLNKLTISGQEVSLSSKVPRGKRAITVPVDNISSVGGMVRPGDHVDIMGMVPMPAMNAEGKQVMQMTTTPLFQDVLVLAVGQEYTTIPSGPSGEKRERTISPIITVALSPQEANLIAFVQEQGRIRLVLRSPEDTQVQPAVPASWDAVLRMVMPQMFVEKPQEEQSKEEVAVKRKVEIYHGLQKEVKNLE